MKLASEAAVSRAPVTVILPYVPPYDWDAMLAFYRCHQVPFVESFDDTGYERVIRTDKGLGWFRVEHQKRYHSIQLSLWNSSESDVLRVSALVRKMFDLDAEPNVIRACMQADPYLAVLWDRYPGLRVPRSWSAFESIFTTTLGQLVSVSFGRVLSGELIKAAGPKALHPKSSEFIHLFPSVKEILEADLSTVRTLKARKQTLQALARLAEERFVEWNETFDLKSIRKTLLSVPGIGVWTAEYAVMRGFRDNDAFPATDYALKQELQRHPELHVERVRPWRAYAATVLWKSFAAEKKKHDETFV